MKRDSSYTPLLRLRIWLWKLRYGWRIYRRSRSHDDWIGSYLSWCVTDCAQAGWEVAVQNEGSVEAALKTDPADEAECELECWTDG